MAVDLTGVSVFLAVAEARSFRAAAEHLGVTRSAVSQAIRRLEDRLGVALVQRTTRSVSLTEAGAQLHRRMAPAIGEIGAALDATADRDSAPSGQLRLAVSSIAERFIAGPLLAELVLFDEYRGPGLDAGRRSLAIGLILQAESRTLTDRDVDAVVNAVVGAAGTEFGAMLRA